MIDRSLHPNTKVLMDAWRRMKADPKHHAASGPRANEHAGLIDSLFVLHQEEDASWTFRTAGEAITTLIGRDLTEHNFLHLWTGPDRAMISAFLEAVRMDGAPGLLRGRGETLTGQRVEIEITLAPLQETSDNGAPRRLLGLYQTLGGEPLLNGRPVWRHRVSMLAPPDTRTEGPQLRLVASNS